MYISKANACSVTITFTLKSYCLLKLRTVKPGYFGRSNSSMPKA